MKITLAIMCYKQQDFIRETLLGAFAQDHDGLNILISDDNSPDGTYDVIRRTVDDYDGPHNITINRNVPNKGLIGHVNHLFELAADSDLIVYNAGDDISEPDRVSVLAQAYRETGAWLLHSDVLDMRPDGKLWGSQRRRKRQRIGMDFDIVRTARTNSTCIGATCAWSPRIMDDCGPITETDAIEDRVFYFRARLLERAHYIDQKLVRYRRGVGLTARTENDLDHDRRYLRMDIASFRQRLKDARILAPERADIAGAIEHKIAKRQRELASLEKRAAEQDGENGGR
ncbi:glycosyltransferase [Paracoccus aurantiacus]|uniref:Glycosyltransferase n=1 Tax=Paracoccus aurantiacus TaxID=2599412 RepID=A0A5C6S7U5_9RHOB|nr:glycosyltransferase [Paracoccus aurantiacus]TXB70929.1 glycosyltransferase [Paracoccus aurantiacus]